LERIASMHKFMTRLFGFIKSTLHFLRIVCALIIILLALYWVQNLLHANWAWLGFIAPFFEWLLNSANKIYSISFDLFGTVFELKYLSAIIILVIASFALRFLIFGTSILEGLYNSAHFVCKKTEETIFNKKLQNDITNEQKKLLKYTVVIHTKIKSKYSYQEAKINIDEQNQLMNKFISEKLNVKSMLYQGGYMYSFNNFERIDLVLDVLFKVINSTAPLSYAICIQVGDNIEQLNKLIELKNFGKIVAASDTAYRYNFNSNKHYNLTQAGLFQYKDDTIELHEFKEVL